MRSVGSVTERNVVAIGGVLARSEQRRNTRLHTEVYGPKDAPVLVLAHGVLCAIEFWRTTIEQLASDYRVVAYDQRGHGRSDSPRRGSYTLDHLADDLAAVLDAVVPEGGRAVLAGQSLGGIAVLALAGCSPRGAASPVR